MHKNNSIYNKCFKYYIGDTKFVLLQKMCGLCIFYNVNNKLQLYNKLHTRSL